MPRPIPNLVGRVFGALTILKQLPTRIHHSGKHSLMWLVRCSLCGKKTEMDSEGQSLRGRICCKTCSEKKKQGNTYNLRHGFARVQQGSVYRAWVRIHTICNHPNNQLYPKYGGRDISCEWDTFEEFYEDVGREYPGPGHRLRRLDTNDDFKLDNCYWQRIGTGVNGVSFHNSRRKYVASIRIDGKGVHLGYFDTLEEAATVRRMAERTAK